MINIGLVGCGRVSASHIKAINALQDDLQLVAVCDNKIDAAKDVAAKYKSCGAYDDVNVMIAKEKLDAIIIATPNGSHYELAKLILKAKINVICEKPLALSYQDGQEMVETARKNGVRLFLIYQNRYNETCVQVRRAFEQNRFGRIYSMVANIFWTRSNDYYAKSKWHGKKDVDGGAIFTQASHYLDLMQWFANAPIKRIKSTLYQLARDIETEDTGYAILEWENGTTGSVNMSVLTYGGDLEGSLTILGEKGVVRIGGVALNNIEHWKFSETLPEDATILHKNYNPESVYGNGHVGFYTDFIHCMQGKSNMLLSESEALADLDVLCRIHETDYFIINPNKK